MRRIIKAEVAYLWWQSAGIICVMALWSLVFFSDSHKSQRVEGLDRLISFVMIALFMAAFFVRMTLQKSEFDENRVRLQMMLPIDAWSIGRARILHYIIIMMTGLPIWFMMLADIPFLAGGKAVWAIVSLVSVMLAMALTMSLANEIQYLPGKHKALTLVVFWSFGIVVIPIVLGMIFAPTREFIILIAKQFIQPWGAAVSVGLVYWVAKKNVETFLRRESYANTHKPEITIFDFFRSFRGEKQYRTIK